MKVSELFRDPVPEPRWGLRGDPYLWQALEKRFRLIELPANSEVLINMVENEYKRLTGQAIEIDDYVYVEEYAHGGMSSGHVSPRFWREIAIPFLIERYEKYMRLQNKCYAFNKGNKVSKILIPSLSPDDWQRFLAEPEKQWEIGYSARALAYCWHEAGGIPPDIIAVLNQVSSLSNLKTVFAIPEHKVSLPGGSRASQNDVWALAQSSTGLVSMTVEGKVSESFGPTIGEWFKNKTPGKEARLRFLCSELELEFPPPLEIRYQLLHRTVSAILEAKRFSTREAVMVVHSFSKTSEWIEDYQYFLSLFDLKAGGNEAVSMVLKNGITLGFAWVQGAEKYLNA